MTNEVFDFYIFFLFLHKSLESCMCLTLIARHSWTCSISDFPTPAGRPAIQFNSDTTAQN